jgi:hypothetical protein
MAHGTPTMPTMKDPSKALRLGIRNVNLGVNILHDQITMTDPFLNGEKPNINMTGARSRANIISNMDRSFIVLIEDRETGDGQVLPR